VGVREIYSNFCLVFDFYIFFLFQCYKEVENWSRVKQEIFQANTPQTTGCPTGLFKKKMLIFLLQV